MGWWTSRAVAWRAPRDCGFHRRCICNSRSYLTRARVCQSFFWRPQELVTNRQANAFLSVPQEQDSGARGGDLVVHSMDVELYLPDCKMCPLPCNCWGDPRLRQEPFAAWFSRDGRSLFYRTAPLAYKGSGVETPKPLQTMMTATVDLPALAIATATVCSDMDSCRRFESAATNVAQPSLSLVSHCKSMPTAAAFWCKPGARQRAVPQSKSGCSFASREQAPKRGQPSSTRGQRIVQTSAPIAISSRRSQTIRLLLASLEAGCQRIRCHSGTLLTTRCQRKR